MKARGIFVSAALSALFSSYAQAGVPVRSLVITGYELWLSTATDCSKPVKVIDNGAAGKEIDIQKSTDFGAGALPPDGTYNCLIVVISDTQTLVPDATGTAGDDSDKCVIGTTYVQDTCHQGSAVLPDGTTTSCSEDKNQKVAAYISTTGKDGADGHSADDAKKLNTPIVIAGASLSKTMFVSNPDGLVNQNDSCGSNANAVVGFR